MSCPYLTADELASLVDCKPHQVAVMVRWLERNRWPYVRDRRGFPKVARSFHDARMHGTAPAGDAAVRPRRPNFAAIGG